MKIIGLFYSLPLFSLDKALNLDLEDATALSKSHPSLSVEIQKSFTDGPCDFNW